MAKAKVVENITGIEFKHTPLRITNQEELEGEVTYAATEGYVYLIKSEDGKFSNRLKTFEVVADKDDVCNIAITEAESDQIKANGGVFVKFFLTAKDANDKEFETSPADFELSWTNPGEPEFETPEVLSAKFTTSSDQD